MRSPRNPPSLRTKSADDYPALRIVHVLEQLVADEHTLAIRTCIHVCIRPNSKYLAKMI